MTPVAAAAVGYAGVTAEVKKLGEIEAVEAERIRSGFTELDRVLGGGFVPGSVVLIGGDPGAGKKYIAAAGIHGSCSGAGCALRHR